MSKRIINIAVFVSFAVIILGLIIWVLVWAFREDDTSNDNNNSEDNTEDTGGEGDLGDPCTTTDDCEGDLVCSNGTCKVDEGGKCKADEDCSTGNCWNGVCVLSVDCDDNDHKNKGVIRESTCENSIIQETLFEDCKILDVSKYKSDKIFLSDKGIILGEDSPVILNIKGYNPVDFSSISSFQGKIFVVSKGRLYQLVQEDDSWDIHLVSWAPHNIFYIYTTKDGKHLIMHSWDQYCSWEDCDTDKMFIHIFSYEGDCFCEDYSDCVCYPVVTDDDVCLQNSYRVDYFFKYSIYNEYEPSESIYLRMTVDSIVDNEGNEYDGIAADINCDGKVYSTDNCDVERVEIIDDYVYYLL